MKYFLYAVLTIVALFMLGFLLNALNLASFSFWAPKQEAARREVYEQTPSYVQGKNQYLTRLHSEWAQADSSGRGVLCATARHEASTLDPENLSPNLQTWECVK